MDFLFLNLLPRFLENDPLGLFLLIAFSFVIIALCVIALCSLILP